MWASLGGGVVPPVAEPRLSGTWASVVVAPGFQSRGSAVFGAWV